MKVINKIRTVFWVLATLQLVACTPQHSAMKLPGMANPATNWCVKVGGEPSQVNTEAGVVGYCTLPSGERVEQWKLYHQSHPAAASTN